MGATQLGVLAFLLLCARLWPDDRPVPLIALSWRVLACAAITLLATALINALLLAPAQFGYLQWLLGVAVAAVVAVALCPSAGGEQGAGISGLTAPSISLCVAAGIVVLLATQPDPFAVRAPETLVQPRTQDMLHRLAAAARTLFVLLVGLAAFGGLTNRALAQGTWASRGAPRLLLVAVLALPVAGIAPWFAG